MWTVQDEKNELENFRLVAENFISQRDYSSLKYLYNLESNHQVIYLYQIRYVFRVDSNSCFIYCDNNKLEAVSKLEKLIKEKYLRNKLS